MSIKEYGISKENFYRNLDDMCEQAFDDQCTGANPRYPLISEIKEMYINSFDLEEAKKSKSIFSKYPKLA